MYVYVHVSCDRCPPFIWPWSTVELRWPCGVAHPVRQEVVMPHLASVDVTLHVSLAEPGHVTVLWARETNPMLSWPYGP